MLRKLFSGDQSKSRQGGRQTPSSAVRFARHSSGWGQMLRHFTTEENLRVLDVGPTSSNNINYVTGLGHSIYMADLVAEAASPQWTPEPVDGQPAEYDVDGFVAEHMDFAGRQFDAVLLWDAIDFLPPQLVGPVMARLHHVMRPGARILAFFHNPGRDLARGKGSGGSDSQNARAYSRYHLTSETTLQVQPIEGYAATASYNNRAIEKLVSAYSSHKFLLAKDSLLEVIVTR